MGFEQDVNLFNYKKFKKEREKATNEASTFIPHFQQSSAHCQPCYTPKLFPRAPGPRFCSQSWILGKHVLVRHSPARPCHPHTWPPLYCIRNCHQPWLTVTVGSGNLIKLKCFGFVWFVFWQSPVAVRAPVENRNTPGAQPRRKQQVVVTSGDETGEPGSW